MAKRKSPLTSTRIAKRKRNLFIARIILIVFDIGLLIFCVWKFVHLPAFLITSVEVQGNTAINSDDISAIAYRDITGNYGYFFPRSNKFIYPKQQIQSEVLALSERIQSVNVSAHGQDLVISITERTPAYVWCDGVPQLVRDQTKPCYFMDKTGFIFSPAPTFSGNVFYVFYGGIATTTPIGQTYMDSTRFTGLNSFIASTTALGLKSFGLNIVDADEYDLYLDTPGRIIFKDAADYSPLISTLNLLLKQANVFKPTGTSTLDYVDLRYGNKVYYK